jgi:hypothetical protein
VLIGAVLVAAAIIGGIVLLVAGDDDNDESTTSTSPDLAALQEEFLTKTVTISDRGISLRRPSDWKDEKQNGAITVRSPSGCVALTASVPNDTEGKPFDADSNKKVHDDAIEAFKKTGEFKNVKVNPQPDKEVGGLPTKNDTITLTTEGNRLTLLLSVGKGEKYTYLTETVVSNPQCQQDLQTGRLIVSSIEYSK